MPARDYIIWAVFAAVCLAIFLISKKMNKQIEEDGIETTGVISRIEDTSGDRDISLCYYARYRTDDGEEVEGVITNPTADLMEGQQVRLKYHPKYKENARIM